MRLLAPPLNNLRHNDDYVDVAHTLGLMVGAISKLTANYDYDVNHPPPPKKTQASERSICSLVDYVLDLNNKILERVAESDQLKIEVTELKKQLAEPEDVAASPMFHPSSSEDSSTPLEIDANGIPSRVNQFGSNLHKPHSPCRIN